MKMQVLERTPEHQSLYWVPNHQRWMNGGKFDGGQLTQEEKDLRDFIKTIEFLLE
jgi:hypothetical protein